jgi:hypothetical protein
MGTLSIPRSTEVVAGLPRFACGESIVRSRIDCALVGANVGAVPVRRFLTSNYESARESEYLVLRYLC